MRETYDYAICEYCRYTDYGTSPVNTGYWNLCEGMGCEEAIKDYESESGEKWEVQK